MSKSQRFLHLLYCMTAVVLLFNACQPDAKRSDKQQVEASTLFDKTLEEVKVLVNGRWELVSCKNSRETGEFENTFITFDDDRYIWAENGKDEPGDLNWRKLPTGVGYDAWLMDAFLEKYPSFPLAISGDTLYIQDITETAYKYTLIRKD